MDPNLHHHHLDYRMYWINIFMSEEEMYVCNPICNQIISQTLNEKITECEVKSQGLSKILGIRVKSRSLTKILGAGVKSWGLE